MPIITAITIIEAKPEIAKIPNVAKTQIKSKTPAICLNGEGRIPIATQMTAKISRFQSVMDCPLIIKSCMSGIVGSPSTLKYPKNQRAISIIKSIPSMNLL